LKNKSDNTSSAVAAAIDPSRAFQSLAIQLSEKTAAGKNFRDLGTVKSS
jgi:hypothetical protein